MCFLSNWLVTLWGDALTIVLTEGSRCVQDTDRFSSWISSPAASCLLLALISGCLPLSPASAQSSIGPLSTVTLG